MDNGFGSGEESLVKLQIEKMVYGGAGLAHQTDGSGAGRAVFVPFTLPGEVVEARLTETKGESGEAALVCVVEGSKDRVGPGCVHFGECGGCHYQHAAYEAQLGLKRGILMETLQRSGLTSLPEVQVHSAEAWRYRNRIRLRVAEVAGELRVGYVQRGSAEFLPVRMCPIAAPLLWRAAEALLKLGRDDAASAVWVRAAVEVEFFTTADEGRLQMTLFVRKEPGKGFAEFCGSLQGLVPELVGAGVAVLAADVPGRGRKVQRVREGVAWGVPGLSYAAAGESYWVSRGGFFQVNRFLVDELVQLVTAGRRGGLAWDLYAGVGLFSRALGRGFEQVVAVEAAAGDLTQTFKGEGRQAVAATTVEFLRRAVVQRERPELVVMDPPRAGVGAEVCALLARVRAAEMVYVSCDPVTLGRDLKAMVDSGYRLMELHMVDLFPQTFHVETMALLRR
ncbi:MAG: (Uracil-5)-methyltransferase [Edaphobacter sp.]|nr:(Uracil-5)-methyltransferase [Edaphobacter sp.]